MNVKTNGMVLSSCVRVGRLFRLIADRNDGVGVTTVKNEVQQCFEHILVAYAKTETFYYKMNLMNISFRFLAVFQGEVIIGR